MLDEKKLKELVTNTGRRNVENINLFTTVARDLHNNSVKYHDNNNIEYLTSSIFVGRGVHKAYYEEIKDGVFYVTNCETGRLIRKDRSIPLNGGRFISIDSPNILRDNLTIKRLF